MTTEILKYKVIKDKEQYLNYCNQLEDLSTQENTDFVQYEIELLTVLIEKFDDENNSFSESDPIALLRSFMHNQQLNHNIW